MWVVTIDAVSVKELDAICDITGIDIWNDAGFEYYKDAQEFARWVREIAPLAEVEVVQ